MAAYAALVSLTNIIEQIQNHPRLSFTVNRKQIESLQEQASFLQDFMEGHSHGGSREAEVLESQIASVAHTAEDVIETHLVDQLLARSPIGVLNLQKVIEDMGSIKKKVIKIQKKMNLKYQNPRFSKHLHSGLQKVKEGIGFMKGKIMKIEETRKVKDQQPTSLLSSTLSRPSPISINTIVGFDDELIQLMDRLTGQQSKRQIVSIVGMGGIGKTTLAKSVYANSVIVEHFDIRAWVTISQEYSVREVLLQLLSCQKNSKAGTSEKDKRTEDQLGEQLYKSLSGMRYLIALDDVWSTEVWDKIKLFLPDNNNRSRILVTTRLSNVAIHDGSWCLTMRFLDDDTSWNLFCEKAFGKRGCPTELEETGKKISRSCKGLPLSIVVIGGLLAKSSMTKEYWENVARDINSILSSGEEDLCFYILSLSYNHLPIHLKPCFLYMGVFPEDHDILASRLIKLWVAEGFLKPSKTQSLEEIAESYLQDLIERNVISVYRLASNGKVKTCKIHDLLRALCLRVAVKEKFLCVIRPSHIPKGLDCERRIVLHESMQKEDRSLISSALVSAPLTRSLISKVGRLTMRLRLLRVLNVIDRPVDPWQVFQQVNLRYLACGVWMRELPSSISLLWNVQTLIIRGTALQTIAPSVIWHMPQLRHLELEKLYLPYPPPSGHVDQQDGDDFVLPNLQTLLKVANFRWSMEALKRIPNVKKLHLEFDDFSRSSRYYCLYNLDCLQKLESLNLLFYKPPNRVDLLKNLKFPSFLRKLSLTNCKVCWEDLTMIGSLPHLEVLKLERDSAIGHEWNPVEGEFLCLKYLEIYHTDLIYWNADKSHFPVLENLVLDQMPQLDEIPSGIGEIPTLRHIHLRYCRESAAISAMEIVEEQESFGNEGIHIQVEFWNKWDLTSFKKKVEMERFTSSNIQLEAGIPKPRGGKMRPF